MKMVFGELQLAADWRDWADWFCASSRTGPRLGRAICSFSSAARNAYTRRPAPSN